MADQSPPSNATDRLTMFLVLSRGPPAAVTLVTALDPAGAMRAFARARSVDLALREVAAIDRRKSHHLVAALPDTFDPTRACSQIDWLAGLATADGPIALFEEIS
ncbi:MAG: hypothetical protein ACRCXM_17665 [Beijerinckiaceae bacterium]